MRRYLGREITRLKDTVAVAVRNSRWWIIVMVVNLCALFKGFTCCDEALFR